MSAVAKPEPTHRVSTGPDISLDELQLAARCTILFSPSHEQLRPGQLADWVLEDHLPVRFQVQLHKYLWGNVAGK